MKRRKSFVRRHIIAISFLVAIAIYSGVMTFQKQEKLHELKMRSEAALIEIERLERELDSKRYELARIDNPDFVERIAREKLKMVRPNEVYFQMMYGKEE